MTNKALLDDGRLVSVRDESGSYRGAGVSANSGWWAVRCLGCRKPLTKYDFTREQALKLAAGAKCSCTRKKAR